MFVTEKIPGDAIFIIGAGRFGSRAARLLDEQSNGRLFVLDTDHSRLSELGDVPVKRIPCDGILFLVENFHLLNPGNVVVPAVPMNLVYEWLHRYLKEDYIIRRIETPQAIEPLLPHTWPGSEGSLLISYADFVCPDDCPEPGCCTVTGERRERPLYDLLNGLDAGDFRVHVIRSRQLAPGLGGYKVADLAGTAEKLTRDDRGQWLLGTSCKCHGIVTALDIRATGLK
ncbi:MAG: hypothetical protein GY849_17855 [Deltaproteobacteria bacterium]|nr:hypothetical protein [Deltaproteobacteria bacterium]